VKEEEIEQFRQMLVELRRKLANNVSHLEQDALRNSSSSVSELSDIPLEHLADRGTDNFARDMMLGILQRSEAEVRDIDYALEKIETGEFGVCESCEEPIAKARLKALPFARLCKECKEEEERSSGEY